MEKLVEELRTVIPFKDTTGVGDIVLIVAQNPQMVLYGFITSIERDKSKKDEWWNIGLTLLSVPLQKVVWTLRTAQMTGQEIFTMGGKKRFFQAVDLGNGRLLSQLQRTDEVHQKKRTLKRIK